MVTSFANRTLKSSGTKTPISFLCKSALTSSIVLTRILYTIALTEKKTNRCHCHYHCHDHNHFQHSIINCTATKTPISFLCKSALTSSIVLTRILYTIALTEKKTNRCHCHYHCHDHNHFQHSIINCTATIINIVIVILVIIVVLPFLYFSNNFEILCL